MVSSEPASPSTEGLSSSSSSGGGEDEEAVASAEALAKALSNRSACCVQVGEYGGAVRDAEWCVRVRPSWAKGWYRLGRGLLGEGKKPGEAESAFARALELEPGNGEVARWLGKAREGVAAARAAEMRKRRYRTDYARFSEEAVAEEAPREAIGEERRGPVVETVEEMHDLMAKKQQALLDAQPKAVAAFSPLALGSPRDAAG
eukprot:CAMPEP_0197392454 /NCGR_PEP_ID=MMETSP1165-20131217/3735_1 /TAXON_ID=284809 /ORGANISM="Chrysocystis fragilis, Strain CCMP3189" /LENGTH=202 /DNA_ID=CAMNT_0042918083 /DNA_START=1 /DNA_END=605 /DNA_ORIENTATION=+